MLDNASNKPSKFKTKSSVEINDEPRGGYNVNSQIKFKPKMLKSSLCDYRDAYVAGTGRPDLMSFLDALVFVLHIYY